MGDTKIKGIIDEETYCRPWMRLK